MSIVDHGIYFRFYYSSLFGSHLYLQIFYPIQAYEGNKLFNCKYDYVENLKPLDMCNGAKKSCDTYATFHE